MNVHENRSKLVACVLVKYPTAETELFKMFLRVTVDEHIHDIALESFTSMEEAELAARGLIVPNHKTQEYGNT